MNRTHDNHSELSSLREQVRSLEVELIKNSFSNIQLCVQQQRLLNPLQQYQHPLPAVQNLFNHDSVRHYPQANINPYVLNPHYQPMPHYPLMNGPMIYPTHYGMAPMMYTGQVHIPTWNDVHVARPMNNFNGMGYGVPPNSRQQTTMHTRDYHRGQPLITGYAGYQKQSTGENGRRERPVPDVAAPRGNERSSEPAPSNGNQPVHTELPSEDGPIQHTQDQPPLELIECHEAPSTHREAPALSEGEGDDILTENSSAAPDKNPDYDDTKKAPSPEPKPGTSEPQYPTQDITEDRDTHQPFLSHGRASEKTGRRKIY